MSVTKSKIEWTDSTWSPVRGCSRVSEGCRNCYAERVASRFSGPGLPYEGLAANGKWTGKTRLVESALDQPLKWKRPRRIFVNSMSDLFHESLNFDDIASVFHIMADAQHHTFQVLTKRPRRMMEWLNEVRPSAFVAPSQWPLRNVWLGVSVENQAAADERIHLLMQTPAAVRFLSCEPLLSAIDLRRYLGEGGSVDWVIAGGESGPGARPMHPDWVRSLRDQCAAAGTPFFFKQWGAWAPNCLCFDKGPCVSVSRPPSGRMGVMFKCGKRAAGRQLDDREHSEFPAVPR